MWNLIKKCFQPSTTSILQDYAIRPFLTEIAAFVPSCIHPNMITLIGGVFAVLAYKCLVEHQLHLCGICILVYVFMDDLDGIHARRSKQTSQFGAILDHCVDGVYALPLIQTCALYLVTVPISDNGHIEIIQNVHTLPLFLLGNVAFSFAQIKTLFTKKQIIGLWIFGVEELNILTGILMIATHYLGTSPLSPEIATSVYTVFTFLTTFTLLSFVYTLLTHMRKLTSIGWCVAILNVVYVIFPQYINFSGLVLVTTAFCHYSASHPKK